MTADPAALAPLLRELDHLPTRGTTAVDVLWLVNDPRVSSEQLARVVQGDEALTTRIMKMANAPYYGLSGRVASATFAVTVLGFDTVRAIAATAAAGVLQDGVPEWMLTDASLTAAAAGILGPRVGSSSSEATSLGLLHNLGSMLLHRSNRTVHTALTAHARREGLPIHELEAQRFGAPGHELAAAALRRWSFPSPFIDAMCSQRAPLDVPRTALGRVLVASIAIAEEISDPTPGGVVSEERQAAMALAHAEPELVQRIADQAGGLHPSA